MRQLTACGNGVTRRGAGSFGVQVSRASHANTPSGGAVLLATSCAQGLVLLGLQMNQTQTMASQCTHIYG